VVGDDTSRVLLISANDLVWTGVHVALQSVSDVEVVDDVTDLALAVPRSRELQPDVLVTGLRLGGISMLPSLDEIRACCPETRFVVLAEVFQPDELLALATLNVAACLLWRDLDFTALHRCVAVAMHGEFVIVSRPVAAQLMDLREAQHAEPPIALTERERVVLQGLARGLTQEQIAHTAALGLRTVKRTTAALAEKLQAPSHFVLGVRARDLGLVASVA